jgi:hypothetical protein
MKTYKHIFNLGYNCEVSFQIERYFGKLESSLFSWVYVDDDFKFMSCIKNLSQVTNKLELTTWNMYRNTFGVSWHGDNMLHLMYHSKDRTPDDITDDEIKEDKKKIRDKIRHLKEKFVRTLDNSDNILFIYKPKNQKVDKKYYDDLRQHLTYNLWKISKRLNFEVMFIGDKNNEGLLQHRTTQHITEFLDFLPEDGNVQGADEKSWNKIFSIYKIGG